MYTVVVDLPVTVGSAFKLFVLETGPKKIMFLKLKKNQTSTTWSYEAACSPSVHPGGTGPLFKMHLGGTVPPFKIHPVGTLCFYDIYF